MNETSGVNVNEKGDVRLGPLLWFYLFSFFFFLTKSQLKKEIAENKREKQ